MKLELQAIDITPEFCYPIIKELQRNKIKFIVAPYEADAQLAYLARKQLIDFVITEDSDLLVFGCPKVLYKIDFCKLQGRMVKLSNLECLPKINEARLSHSHFMYACILSGCDYLENIPQMGFKTAL